MAVNLCQDYFLESFFDICHKNPSKIAIKCISEETVEITYYGLMSVSYNFAKKLRFIPKHSCVGLITDQNNCWISSLILAIWIKKCSVALITKPSDEMLSTCGINFLIASEKCNILLTKIKKVVTLTTPESKYYVLKTSDNLIQEENHISLCFALTTSGSTGIPRIVRVPWSCIIPNIIDINKKLGITGDDVIYASAPPTFDPFFVSFIGGLSKGCTLICTNFLQTLHDDFIKKFNITVVHTTPSLFQRGFNEARLVVLGGEPFPTSIPVGRFFNIYGITELSCWAFLHEVAMSGRQPLGQPLSGVEYKIVEGELYLGSDTRKCLVGNEKWQDLEGVIYRKTGDRVEEINKELYFISRNDDLVKKFGVRVDLSEIRIQSLKCQDILDSVCLFDSQRVILVVAVENHSSSLAIIPPALKAKLLQCLTYIPDEIYSTGCLPLTSHGKIDRKILLEHVIRLQNSQKFDFKNLWINVLNVNELDETASFAKSGGGSVEALMLVEQLKKRSIQVPSVFIIKLLDPNSSFKECAELISESDCSNIFKFDLCLYEIKWRHFMEKCVDSNPLEWVQRGEQHAVIGSHSGLVVCINVTTGALLWSQKLPYRVETTALIDNQFQKIFIGCHDHFIYCLDAYSGVILWQFKTNDIIKSSPCITHDNSTLFVASYDKCLYSLKVQDGLMKSCKLLNKGSIRAGLAWCSHVNLLVVATLNGFCGAFANDFTEIWCNQLASPVFSAPQIINESVFVIEVTGNLHCLNVKSGEKLWKFECNSNVFSPISYDPNGCLSIGCHDGTLILLEDTNFTNIKEISKRRFVVPGSIFGSPCFLSPTKIVFFTTNGQLYVVDKNAGKVFLSWKCPGEVFSTPITSNNKILVGSRDNYFNCFIVV